MACRWPFLDIAAKLATSDQLGHFTQLREMPSPRYFGLLGKQPFDAPVFSTADNVDPPVSGPLGSNKQLLGAVVQNQLFLH